MGGTDDPSNLIRLSLEDHAEEHRKLYEQHKKKEDYIAWKCLSGQLDNHEILKEKCRLGGKNTKGVKRKDDFGISVRNRLLGNKLSEETKEKIRQSRIGKKSNFKSHTVESRKKLSDHGKTLMGEKNPFYGKKHSEETKRKISESKKLKARKTLNI